MYGPGLLKGECSQKGFTLLELLVAAGTLSFLMLAMFFIVNSILVNFNKNKTIGIEDQIVLSIRQNLNNNQVLKVSMNDTSNPNLLSCICGGAADCDGSQEYDLRLFEGSVDAPSPVSFGYSAEGSACDPSNPSCVIHAKFSFIPQCTPSLPSADPTPPLVCSGKPAEFVGLYYTISLDSTAQTANKDLNPIRGVVFKTIDELLANDPGFCL
jgi:prepilin-type N-terminal cleavage/methylation domain-containing protein